MESFKNKQTKGTEKYIIILKGTRFFLLLPPKETYLSVDRC
jgi:hypothetical protein